MKDRLVKDVLKETLLLAISLVLSKYTYGVFTVVVALLGVYWAMTGSTGKALSCFVFMPVYIILSYNLIAHSQIQGLAVRLGPLAISMALCLTSVKRPGNHVLPFGTIVGYLLWECISSATGFAPNVSYLKLVNFVMFLVGIWIGTRNLHQSEADIKQLRTTILAICCLFVFGGLMMLPFPAISYCTNLSGIIAEQGEAAAIEYIRNHPDGGVALFSGITNQSQALAPTITCIVGFVLGDMLFVEREPHKLHLALLVCALICSFLSRSRTGLLSMTVTIILMFWFASSKIKFSARVRARIKRMISIGVFGLVIVGAALEASNRTFTRWLRKTDNLQDERSFNEALTDSRQGLIENALYEFSYNRIWGCGFQVNEESQRFVGQGIVLSAPVEKGFLPLVVLGEGGIVGVILFSFFLISFYARCKSKRLYVTMVMFTSLLATNCGEATFFSPGGIGSILWMLAVVGGFLIDTIIKNRNIRENQMVMYRGW